MNLPTISLILLALAITQTHGAIYQQVSQLPTYTYDYIIVGGTFYLKCNDKVSCDHS